MKRPEFVFDVPRRKRTRACRHTKEGGSNQRTHSVARNLEEGLRITRV